LMGCLEICAHSRTWCFLFAVAFGTACLSVHCVAHFIFARLCPPPLNREPGFLAHQVVALLLMPLFAWLGCLGWLPLQISPSTPEDRIFGTFPISEVLAPLIAGSLLLWDIPTSLLVPKLYARATMAHHVAFAVIGIISMYPYLQYYVPFFGGVIEMSSIPLAVVDVFHPKHPELETWARQNACVGLLNAFCRVLFALLFVALRTIYFPWVVLTQMLPDLVSVLMQGHARMGMVAAVVFTLSLALGFMFLQLYWSKLVIGQLLKAVRTLGSQQSTQPLENELLSESSPDD